VKYVMAALCLFAGVVFIVIGILNYLQLGFSPCLPAWLIIGIFISAIIEFICAIKICICKDK
jgi:hypothetical protein